MKNGATIPRKLSKHSKASVERSERERHKAFLTIKPIEWEKTDKQIKMKQPAVKQGKSAGFEKVLYVLQGNEPPEKFILWKKDLHDKVATGKKDWELIMSSLIDLSDKAANTVIRAALDQFKNLKLKMGSYAPFRCLATHKKLAKYIQANNGTPILEHAGQTAWDNLVKSPDDINPIILDEIEFRLEELIFGTDMIGRNAYYLLRRLMRNYKVDAVRGIQEWCWRMNQLNDYMLLVPCDALAKRDAPKEKYTEVEMREILDIALPEAYRKKLFGFNWNTYEEPFKETIDNLLRFEPEIKAEAAKAKIDRELAEKVHGKGGTKRRGDGTPKVLETNKTTCKTCGKQHKGECWSKKGSNGRRNGKIPFEANQMKYINQMLKAHTAKAKESDSDSDWASSSADWKKGINSCQQMYIAQQFRANHGLDSGEDVNSIDDDQLKSYKKKAKKAEKALRK